MRASTATRSLGGRTGRAAARRRASDDGLVLGRYRLETVIGAGGHGTVWRARDERLRRDVAVKVLPRTAGDARAEREARAAARLNHPGIVALYELAIDDHAAYLVSELVPGRTLAELEAGGAISDLDVAEIGVLLCHALGHAHRAGVVHRDVKPQNVIVTDERTPGAGLAKLADFGVARLLLEEPITVAGGVVGTPAYMAPEQAAGGDVTEASDTYSLALLLHEALSGSPPRPSPRPLARLRRDLPAALCEAIDAALEPRPERRPRLEELADALEEAEEQLSDEDGVVRPGALERLRLAVPAPEPRAHSAGSGRARAVCARLAAAAATGALVAAALAQMPQAIVSPLPGAALALVASAVAPRIGWVASLALVCAALAAGGRPGTATFVALAAAPAAALLPRAGGLWSLPALAPLLGLAGLAAAFPALAGLAGSHGRRAGLAAAGLVWLAAAEALTGATLLFGPPAAAAPAAAWAASPVLALTQAAWPLVSSGLLLPALPWALLAVVAAAIRLPRGLAARLALAAGWAALALAATLLAADLLPSAAGAPGARGAAIGVVAGALAVALVPRPAPGGGRAVLP